MESEWIDCDACIDGFTGHYCGEDTCCCADPEPNVVCEMCEGRGGRGIEQEKTMGIGAEDLERKARGEG